MGFAKLCGACRWWSRPECAPDSEWATCVNMPPPVYESEPWPEFATKHASQEACERFRLRATCAECHWLTPYGTNTCAIRSVHGATGASHELVAFTVRPEDPECWLFKPKGSA